MHRAERMLTLCRPLVRLCGVQRPWVMHLSAAGHANATHQDATLRRVPASSHSAYICVHTHTGPDGCPSGVEPSARCTGPKGSLSGIVVCVRWRAALSPLARAAPRWGAAAKNREITLRSTGR